MPFQLCKLYRSKLEEDCEGWPGNRSDKRKIASDGMRFLRPTSGRELFVLPSVGAHRTILYRSHRMWYKEHLWKFCVLLEYICQLLLNII
jgi:hypothetical protein